MPESEVSVVAPELSLATIRRYAYGPVFYRDFRSGYVHEYKTGTYADEYIMSHTRGDITYSNWITPPYRRINFAVAWLVNVTRSICENAAGDYWDGKEAHPGRWWLDG